MDLGLKDKVFLITGGAEGIGGAITEACLHEGAIPVIVNSDSPAVQRFVDGLKADGARFELITMLLDQPETCKAAVDETLRRCGRIDALVNNAGVNDKVGLENGDPESFLTSVKRNLWHYYSMTHYALPALIKSQGSILNIASKTALTGQGETSGYAASKGGVLALTREWAVELLPYSIRVNAIVPSEVMTPQYKRWIATFPDAEDKLASIVAGIPFGKRMTEPSEIAATAIFLLSTQSSHTTGQHVFVDGGYVHLDRAVRSILHG